MRNKKLSRPGFLPAPFLLACARSYPAGCRHEALLLVPSELPSAMPLHARVPLSP
jgi:hypothetical protein